MKKIRQWKRYLVFRLTSRMTFILVILVFALGLSNIYSLKVVTDNQVQSTKHAMTVFLKDIGNYLTQNRGDLRELSLQYLDALSVLSQKNDLDKHMTTADIRDSIDMKVRKSTIIDGMYIVDSENLTYAYQFSNRLSGDEKLILIDMIKTKDYYHTIGLTDRWQVFSLSGSTYLMQTQKIAGYMLGVMMRSDTLLSAIRKAIVSDQILYALTNENGDIISTVGNREFLETANQLPVTSTVVRNYQKKYFVVSQSVADTPFYLSTVVEKGNVFLGLELLQWAIIIVALLSVLIVPTIVLQLYREIVKPVRKLIVATKEVEKGNWEYRITPGNDSAEFAMLEDSFSNMIHEIKYLKIDTYEEKLERQKAELKYLQMQIKPHFFLNTIATISNLSFQNKNQEIQSLIAFLSDHLRYMFKGGMGLVQVRDEMAHVENYIHMQQLRYPNNIFFMSDVQDEVRECSIPKYLLNTFIENIFKHAMTVGEMLSIFIQINKITVNGLEHIHIMIEDNGEGFPVDVINSVNSTNSPGDDDGDSIGIRNIKKTLELFYGTTGALRLANCEPTGARVEIDIPILERSHHESAHH